MIIKQRLTSNEQPFRCAEDNCNNIIDYDDGYYFDSLESEFPNRFCSKKCYQLFNYRPGVLIGDEIGL